MSRKFIPTSEGIEVKDYPYGFRLRTTLFDSMEFNRKKGYRHVTQTINPKNNTLNKPKMSTYYDALVRYYDENGHIKTCGLSFNSFEAMNKTALFLSQNIELFSEEEIEYFHELFLTHIKVSSQAMVIYCGTDFEALKPLIEGNINKIKANIFNRNVNTFENLVFDVEKIEATKTPDFKPFRTVQLSNLSTL